jgi:hypothetical protein
VNERRPCQPMQSPRSCCRMASKCRVGDWLCLCLRLAAVTGCVGASRAVRFGQRRPRRSLIRCVSSVAASLKRRRVVAHDSRYTVVTLWYWYACMFSATGGVSGLGKGCARLRHSADRRPRGNETKLVA